MADCAALRDNAPGTYNDSQGKDGGWVSVCEICRKKANHRLDPNCGAGPSGRMIRTRRITQSPREQSGDA